jgi:hypothetical protein
MAKEISMLSSKNYFKIFCLMASFCLLSACGLNDLTKKSDSDSSTQSGTDPQSTPPNPQNFEMHFKDLTSNAPVSISSVRVSSFPNQVGVSYFSDGFGLNYDNFSNSNSNSFFSVSLIFAGYESCPVQLSTSIGGTFTDNAVLPTLFGELAYFDKDAQKFRSLYAFSVTTEQHSGNLGSDFTACGNKFSITAENISYPPSTANQ